MPEVPVAALADAVRNTHGAEPTFVEAVPVVERFRGVTVWEGAVAVFDLTGHPTANRAYAWSALSKGEDAGGMRIFTTVLHEGPVVSPETAVRVAIAARHRGRSGL